MTIVLYSTAWTGDLALGDAIVELLTESLKKKNISFNVVEKNWSKQPFSKLLGNPFDYDIFVEIHVNEKDMEEAEKCMEELFKDGKKIKETALSFARRKYIKSEEELEEYRKGLEETYGW